MSRCSFKIRKWSFFSRVYPIQNQTCLANKTEGVESTKQLTTLPCAVRCTSRESLNSIEIGLSNVTVTWLRSPLLSFFVKKPYVLILILILLFHHVEGLDHSTPAWSARSLLCYLKSRSHINIDLMPAPLLSLYSTTDTTTMQLLSALALFSAPLVLGVK